MKTLAFILIVLIHFSGYSQDEAQLETLDPSLWGTHIPGVFDHLKTDEKVIALTFDACGAKGDGFDQELIKYLIKNNIPATLFISGRWIKKNPETFLTLSKNSLFRIGNHGTNHRQLSVDGKGRYNWGKTHSQEDIEVEVLKNAATIERLTGNNPAYFRSGTAYYDPGSLSLIKSWNYIPTGFSHSADGGATLSRKKILELGVAKATPGGIYLFHMNWPNKDTFEGVSKLLPELKKLGYSFVYLEDYELEQRILKHEW